MKTYSAILAAIFWVLFSTTVLAASTVSPQSANQAKPRVHPALAIKGYNYTNREVGKVRVEDQYGNQVSLFAIEVGGAFGPVCCARFKGEKIRITWKRTAAFFAPDPDKDLERSTIATIPQYNAKSAQQIALHIYPDKHIEIEVINKKNFMDDDDRLHISEVTRQLWFKKKNLYKNLGADEDESNLRLHLKVADAVGDAWTKYRITNYEDLLFYSFWKIAGLNFEIHPKAQSLLKNAAKKPGAFGAFMENLPKNFGDELDTIEAQQKKQASKK